MKNTYISYKVEGKPFLVKISRKSGHIDHFYHFLLDFVWPFFHSLEIFDLVEKKISDCCTNDKEALFFSDHFYQIFQTPIRKSISQILKFRIVPGKSFLNLVGFNSNRRDYFKIFNSKKELQKSHRIFKNYIFSSIDGADRYYIPLVILIERRVSVKGGGPERRTIVNHRELELALKIHCESKGNIFMNVELTTLTFKQQVALFSRENVTIVGQHGAGLIHLLWLNPENGRLIELMGKRNEHFRNICNDLSISYDVIYCQFIEAIKLSKEQLHVNVNDVLLLI